MYKSEFYFDHFLYTSNLNVSISYIRGMFIYLSSSVDYGFVLKYKYYIIILYLVPIYRLDDA